VIAAVKATTPCRITTPYVTDAFQHHRLLRLLSIATAAAAAAAGATNRSNQQPDP